MPYMLQQPNQIATSGVARAIDLVGLQLRMCKV